MDESPIKLLGLGAALGIGLLIGVEREKNKGSGPGRSAAGVRTYALAALFGAVGQLSGGFWGLVLATVVVAGISVAAYLRSRSEDPGITSEVALVLTCALGGLAQEAVALAAALGVLVALLLVSRSWLHELVRDRMSEREIFDGVMLAAAALIVLPVLPDRAVDPFGVLNPRTVWTLAVVVMLINAAGYLAMRTLGPGAGLPLAGLAGGFVSSIATIGVMGSRALASPTFARAAVAGAALSSVATIVQLAVVIAITNAVLLRLLWPSLIGAGVVAIVYGAAFSIRALRKNETAPADSGRAFQPRTAIVFAVTVTAVLFMAAALHYYLGSLGAVVGVSLAGFADAHSSSVSAASLARTGGLEADMAVLAIVLAFSTNTVTKAVVAWVSGGPRFAALVLPGLLLMLVAAWAGVLIGGVPVF